jgi:site-specific DNA-cytosine methylase
MEWPEARILAEPTRQPVEPQLLVERKIADLSGPGGEEIVFSPGYPVISLFCGIGGFDIGLERAGFVSLVQHERNRECCQTLIANRPRFFRHSALIQGDIYRTPTSMLLKAANLRVGKPYIVCGGPPCQGFSTANTHAVKGRFDAGNDLVFEFLRVVSEAKPHFFIMENVPGFVSFNGSEYLKKFLPAAYGAYYEIVYGLCDASEYGVPQRRCRFICMGTRRDIAEIEGTIASLPRPENFHEKDLAEMKIVCPDGLYRERYELLTHAPGVRYFPDRPVLIPPPPTGHDGRNEKFLEFYRQLRRDEPDRIVKGAL